jgi:RNA polymerase sigma-70 factor (ECF subfamily)
VSPPVAIADHVVVREEVRVVVRLLDEMRAADAEILRLSAWEGLDIAEIATVLDISSDAVKQRLSRARKRLTDMYEAHEKQRLIRTPTAQEGGLW